MRWKAMVPPLQTVLHTTGKRTNGSGVSSICSVFISTSMVLRVRAPSAWGSPSCNIITSLFVKAHSRHYVKISFSGELKYGVALLKTMSGNNNVIIPYKKKKTKLSVWLTFSDSNPLRVPFAKKYQVSNTKTFCSRNISFKKTDGYTVHDIFYLLNFMSKRVEFSSIQTGGAFLHTTRLSSTSWSKPDHARRVSKVLFALIDSFTHLMDIQFSYVFQQFFQS